MANYFYQHFQIFSIYIYNENLPMKSYQFFKICKRFDKEREKQSLLKMACLACLTYLACLRAYVNVCLRAWCACLRACMRACYDETFYFLKCLRTWCAFLSYLFYISILKFENS